LTRAERILLGLLVALVAFSPIFLGGVRGFDPEPSGEPPTALERFLWAEGPWAVELLLALFVGVAALAVADDRRRSGEPSPWGLHRRVLFPFAGLFALALLQAIPLPRFLLGLLSPEAHRNLDFLLPGDSSWRPLTLSPEGTRGALAGLGVGGVVLVGSLLAARRRAGAFVLLAAVVLTHTAVAAYGLGQTGAGDDTVLGFHKGEGKGVTGTYLLRAPMAASAAMALPAALALLFAAVRTSLHGRWRAWAGIAVLAGAAAVLALVVPLTTSRMGFLAAGAGLLALGLLAARAVRWPVWGRGLLVVTAVVLVGSAAREVLDRLPEFRQRFEAGTIERGGFFDIRFPAWKSTVALASRYPALGTGLGTYEVAIHETQTPDNPDELVYAHSEPLHALAEGGIAGFVLAALLAAGALAACLRGAASEDPLVRAPCCGSGAGLAALLVACTTDFPLHVPALGISAAVLAGLAPGLLAGEPGPPSGEGPPRRRTVLLLALGLLLAAVGILDGSRSAAIRGAARRAEQAGDTGKWFLGSFEAVKAAPSSAAARRSRAGAILAKFADAADLPSGGRASLAEADRAVDLEPFNYHGHRARAAALLALGRADEAVQALARARSRAGGIGHLHFAAGKTLLLLSKDRPDLRGAAFDAMRYAGECEPRFFTMATMAVAEAGLPFAECPGIVPDRPFALADWASACSRAGAHGEAFEALLRLWRLEPSPQVREALLDAARSAGREEEGRAAVGR